MLECEQRLVRALGFSLRPCLVHPLLAAALVLLGEGDGQPKPKPKARLDSRAVAAGAWALLNDAFATKVG